MNYLLLTMGGTIDSTPYSEVPGEYPARATPVGQRAYDGLRALLPAEDGLNGVPICAKDSNDIDAWDRQQLVEAIMISRGYDRIIVTMGTDTMCETAQELQSRKLNLVCPVVFTGAIWPLANGAKSDGEANLRLAVTHSAKPDVFIAMGEVFAPAERVMKDVVAKKFVVVE